MTATFRRAQPSDFCAIAALDRAAWGESRHADYIPDGEHAWRLWVEHGLVYCAEEADEILDAILAFPCMSGAHCVHKVFVDSPHRGQGIGTGLFRALLGDLDRLAVDALLTVDPTNEAAIRLYERWGFSQRRFVRGYYRPEEDRFVLTREARP